MTHTPRIVAAALGGVLGTVQTSWAQVSFSRCCPWDTPLADLTANITGPTVKLVAVLIMVSTGIVYATSEGGGFRKIAAVIFGLSIAFAAASWGPGFLGYTGS